MASFTVYVGIRLYSPCSNRPVSLPEPPQRPQESAIILFLIPATACYPFPRFVYVSVVTYSSPLHVCSFSSGGRLLLSFSPLCFPPSLPLFHYSPSLPLPSLSLFSFHPLFPSSPPFPSLSLLFPSHSLSPFTLIPRCHKHHHTRLPHTAAACPGRREV